MNLSKLSILCTIAIFIASCNNPQKTTVTPPQKTAQLSRPDFVIYRTKGNYDELVALQLNEEKNKIVSYPAVRDIQNAKMPEKLAEGFLLDRRGINKNTAFLDYTYQEYSRLSKTPPTDSLFVHIKDADPFEVMFICPQDKAPNDDLLHFFNEAIINKQTKELFIQVIP